MSQSERPPEGNPLIGCLVVGGLVGVIFAVAGLMSYLHERAERLEEAAKETKEAESSIREMVSQLKEVKPGDAGKFNDTGERRQKFVNKHPAFREQLEAAEDEWLKRTLVAFEGDEGKGPAAPAQVIGRLRRLERRCQEGSARRFLPQVGQALESAVASAAKHSDGLLERDSLQALDLTARCLEAFASKDDGDGKSKEDKVKEDAPPAPPELLTEARQRALARCVKDLSGRLKKLPAGDGSGMASWLKERQAVEKAAGAPVASLRQEEKRWLDGTVKAVHAEVEPKAVAEPEKAFARLEGTRTTFAELFATHPESAKVLTEGEGRCLQRAVEHAVAEAGKQGNPAAASARLRQTAEVCARVLKTHEGPARTLGDARRKAVEDALKKARAEARTLVQGERFQAAAKLAERLSRDIGPDAEAVGVGSALAEFRDRCGYCADLARQAGRPDPP